MSGRQQWRPPVGSPVRVALPDGRTLDTTTCSEVFSMPQLVAVNGLRECAPLAWVAPLPPEAPALEYEHRTGNFGPYTVVKPRWGSVP